MTDENWIAKTITPKSDQLNAEDLLTGPITVTVEDVRQGDSDQPVAIAISGRQPYKPCKTMRRVLVALWGERAADWIGRSMTLYADPTVKWGGVAVGGIRISHLSDIENDHTLMLTITRGKRQAFTVKPLQTSAPEKTKPTIAERVDKAIAAYQGCKTQKDLMAVAKKCESLAAECDDANYARLAEAYEQAMERVNKETK